MKLAITRARGHASHGTVDRGRWILAIALSLPAWTFGAVFVFSLLGEDAPALILGSLALLPHILAVALAGNGNWSARRRLLAVRLSAGLLVGVWLALFLFLFLPLAILAAGPAASAWLVRPGEPDDEAPLPAMPDFGDRHP